MAATQQRRTYLHRRGLRWQYRRRVPADLREVLGRSFWVVALATRDLGAARARAAHVDAKLEAAIRGLRLRIGMADEGTITRLVRIYFDRLLAECREYRSAWKPAGGVDARAAVEREIEAYDIALDFASGTPWPRAIGATSSRSPHLWQPSSVSR